MTVVHMRGGGKKHELINVLWCISNQIIIVLFNNAAAAAAAACLRRLYMDIKQGL
jgi:hypothetical protein